MKAPKIYGMAAILTVALSASGCGKNSGSSATSEEIVDQALLANVAANVIIPTYEDLAAKAHALVAAVAALKADATEANLAKTREAWIATRMPWEQNEGFLYGPVESEGFDSRVDSWPLNKTELDAVLDGGSTISDASVAKLSINQKGFHTIEFLIYGTDSKKAATAFKPREFDYLMATSKELGDVATSLETAWDAGNGTNPAYKDVLSKAGDADNTFYPSLTSAAQELINGMIHICNEVADSKIATPFDAQDPNLVESQFSFNSLRDFSDNLRSVENVYLGARQGGTAPAGTSLSEHVAARNAAIDNDVKAEITDAIEKILAIPEPFPVSLKVATNSETIKAAQAAVRALRETLTNDVLPLAK